jgi:UDP-N-acetylmuramate dehydrogenase
MDIKTIENISDVTFYKDINLEKYTTIKLGSVGSIVLCHKVKSLKEILCLCKTNKIIFHIVGWGANQVLLNCSKTLFIKLDFNFDRSIFSNPKSDYYLPASVPLNLLTSHAIKFGLKGWEVFTGIPASFGGAIFMNAGTALGEIGELITEVDIMNSMGDIYTHKCSTESFDYRKNNFVKENEVIIGARIKSLGLDDEIKEKIKNYLEYRKTTQPLTTKNCGSVFKNHSSEFRAGSTIDLVGLKSFGVKKLMVSSKHANFIENKGDATASEFKELTSTLKEELERYSGIKFELEVKVY